MEETTYRQYRVWMKWLDRQWNRPSRTDKYLMAIACEVRRVLAKDPNKHQVEDCRLEFKESKGRTPPSPLHPTSHGSKSNGSPIEITEEDSSTYINEVENDEKEEKTTRTLSQRAITDIAKTRWLGMMTLPVENIPNRQGKDQ